VIKLVNAKGKEVCFANTDIPRCTRCLGRAGELVDGAQVSVGDVIARIRRNPRRPATSPAAAARRDLFEARKPKDSAILAEYSGTVSFGKETKGKRRLIITDDQARSTRS